MADTGRGTVLVVEDDPSIRELLIEALEHEAIHAVPASKGEEAVRLALEARPALVVLDMGLPFIEGPAVAARIRDVYGETVPFIVVTAGRRIEEAANLIRGATYIAKPFDLDDLVRAVRSGIAPAPGPTTGEVKPSVA